jgi:peptidoglycan/LPS O-acetylase OafA/YrhL
MIVTALVSVGAGVLVYWFVERPIIKHFKVPTPKSRLLVADSSLEKAAAAIPIAGQVAVL